MIVINRIQEAFTALFTDPWAVCSLITGLYILGGAFLLLLAIYFVRKALFLHDLSHKTKPNHVWMQVLMLVCFLLAFLWVCIWCAMNSVSKEFLAWIAGAGVLLTWVFQDTIKNVVAFVTLVWNGMLHIGDWIIVDKHGIDGKVKDISLTSVIVENWDNTLSTISTHSLLDTQVQNLQNVVANKTAGRRMMRNFLIDIHSVRALSSEEIEQIKKCLVGEDLSAIDSAQKQGDVQNLRLYRIYLQHWLLSQKTVSRFPKFAVRLLEPTSEGLPLQIYAFLLRTQWEEFEQEQSRIVEHVISTMELFGLVFFQYPAGTDTNKVELKK